MRRFVLTGLFLVISLIFYTVTGPQAQAVEKFQYVVKFVCGYSDGKVVAAGQYQTAINVFNNPTNPKVTLKKHFVVALPSQEAGPVSEIRSVELEKNRALEIDYGDIMGEMKKLDVLKFAKGFVVIASEVELDVVAVYTVHRKPKLWGTAAVDIDIEYVTPRVFP